MGRYSDSEEEKKKRKKKKKKRSRSRSRSGSIESRHSSTKQKKSKKKKKKKSRSRSESKSPDRFGRVRKSRSRSRSHGRRSRSRSHSRRSRSRDRYRKRSRSLSRGRYSRSRSRDRRRRRSRSNDSYSRSSRRSRSHSPGDRKRKKSKEREDPCLSIPGFENMAPSDQARIRMQMALKAAAAADEKIKGDYSRQSSGTSMQDSLAFSNALQDIESSSFSASSFKSSRGDKKEEKVDKDEFVFGTAGELRLDTLRKPVIVDVDKEDLFHPSLRSDPEEQLTKWIQRLTTLRRRKLEGDALS